MKYDYNMQIKFNDILILYLFNLFIYLFTYTIKIYLLFDIK